MAAGPRSNSYPARQIFPPMSQARSTTNPKIAGADPSGSIVDKDA
jgi:hypothetical protein